MLEEYISAGGRKLRCGFTTGTCAALAAKAAATRLLCGSWPQNVQLRTPKGVIVTVVPECCAAASGQASCAVRKDAGDDTDCTDGALIFAAASFADRPGVSIEGGKGVGRVTKPGLDQPVGAAAINRVPRRMIEAAVADVCRACDYKDGLAIEIYVPDGEIMAEKTFNSGLGITGGISILGTSGIVEPMSVQALTETVRLGIRQQAALGARDLILTPGNYGVGYLRETGLSGLGVPVVRCSNFIGEALDEAAAQKFKNVLIVGHAGKLVKLAGGIMNTHSRWADCRTELICAHAAVCGADRVTCGRIMDAATTDACIAILEESGLREAVFAKLAAAAEVHLKRRAAGAFRTGAVIFSLQYGELARTEDAELILDEWRGRTGKSSGD